MGCPSFLLRDIIFGSEGRFHDRRIPGGSGCTDVLRIQFFRITAFSTPRRWLAALAVDIGGVAGSCNSLKLYRYPGREEFCSRAQVTEQKFNSIDSNISLLFFVL